MKAVTIYVLFCKDVFRDVFASYSEAIRESHPSGCCRIDRRERMDY